MGQLPLRDDKSMSLGGSDLKERRERERERRVPRPRMHANFHDRQSTVIKATASFEFCAQTDCKTAHCRASTGLREAVILKNARRE
jgi:hypothetical protein